MDNRYRHNRGKVGQFCLWKCNKHEDFMVRMRQKENLKKISQ